MIRTINANCLDVIQDFIKDGRKVDCIICDPPYEIVRINGGGTVNNIKKLNKSLQDLDKANLVDGYDIETYNSLFVQIMKNINIYIWCNKKQIPKYFDFYVNRHKCKFDIICWHKTNALPTYSNKYLSDTEYCLYFRKGGNKCKPQSYEDAKTFYLSPLNQKDKKLYNHPTIKPLELTKKFIRNSTERGDLVFDPFMGSGTTGVACKKLCRDFIGVELVSEYYTIAEDRIKVAE